MELDIKRDCAGFVVFRKLRGILQVLLIDEPFKKVPVGFPKGKIEEGETPFIAACRELEEETGILAGKLLLTNGVFIENFWKDGTPHITYYVAICKRSNDVYRQKLPRECFWMDVERAQKMNSHGRLRIQPRRCDILTESEQLVSKNYKYAF